MLELSIIITDDKLIQTGDILSCVANEINSLSPSFTVTFDSNNYRCFKYNDHKIILGDDYDDLNSYNTIPQKMEILTNIINKHSSETNLTVKLNYTDSLTTNDIDFQETAHPTPSLKMSNYRKLLKEGHDVTYPCCLKRKIFWITKEIESILLRHFDNMEDIYAFKLSFDDISFDGFYDGCGYDLPYYIKGEYSDVKWRQIYYTKKGSLRLTSAFDDNDDKDENKFVDFTFYEDETLSKRFFVIFDFFKRQAYPRHQRTNKVQTFEYINDGATLELTELMFVHDVKNDEDVHDDEDMIRIFKRQDSLNVHEDQAVCEEMKDVKVYKLGFNTFTDDEDELFFDYVEDFYIEAKQENEELKNQLKEAESKIADLKKDLRALGVARK